MYGYITEGAWKLVPLVREKCLTRGIEQERLTGTSGLDSLNISGSAAFSEGQFWQLADDSRELADVYALRSRRIRQVYEHLHTDQRGEAGLAWSEWLAGRVTDRTQKKIQKGIDSHTV